MKNLTITIRLKSNFMAPICFLLFVGVPANLYAQDYRTIDAYLDDFAKNEMFIKKALMDYTITIVESQLDSRSKVTAKRIIEKIENINNILKKTDNGFEGNTVLRDGFIKMNEKTMESLTNGNLNLSDYAYQSSLPLSKVCENFNTKEREIIEYYNELKDYENDKKYFGKLYRLHFKKKSGKDILEYNAYENIMFYKINVLDEKIDKAFTALNKKDFTECMKTLELVREQVLDKTAQLKNYFKDNSLNNANIDYANYIYDENKKLEALFNEYVDSHESLEYLKQSTVTQNNEFAIIYNQTVKKYNLKKNDFYYALNQSKTAKKAFYDKWLLINSNFLKNNGEFEDIHGKYVYTD